MIPNNSLSLVVEYSNYLYPDNLSITNTTDYELGGIGLNDTSQGLEVQAWFLQITGTPTSNNVVISAANWPATTLFSLPSITEVSLAFDQNMNPFIAYVSQGNPFFYWFDATVPGYKHTAMPAGATSPRCTLDDKRPISTLLGTSDIILAYIKNNNLYFMQQRDRYTVEYVLQTNLNTYISNPYLYKVGMNDKYRLQFQINGQLYQ